MDAADRITIARMRLYSLGQRLRAGVDAIGGGARAIVNLPVRAANGLLYGGAPRDPIPPSERDAVAAFAGADFSDRTRRYNFEATDANGRKGRYTVTLNELLLIEHSYDEAATRIRSLLGQLVAEGILTEQRPSVGDFADVSRYQNLAAQERAVDGEWNIFSYGEIARLPTRIADPRMFSGGWFDWPNYAGLVNAGYNQPETAFLFNSFSPGPWLPGIPLARDWTKLYPTPRLWDRRAFPDERLIAILEELTVQMVTLCKGANANPEWHPALVMGNNGVFPWWSPSLGSSGIYREIEGRYQYKVMHPWARLTRDNPLGNTGFTLSGKTDYALWLGSIRTRSPRAYAERHTPAGAWNNDWAAIHYADGLANFVQFCNMARFMLELGAAAHVSAACEYHAAVMLKAYDELGLPAGASVQDYVNAQARERAARASRSSSGGAELSLVSGPTASEDRQIVNSVLNGALNMSMALFLANPYVGAVALAITGVAVFVSNLFLGRAFDCHGENLLVRDGRVAVRSVDEMECAGSSGNVYGGNYLPHTRAAAIRGRPAMRVKDRYGREVST